MNLISSIQAGQINLEDIQNGITIDNAPASLSQIFIFGNPLSTQMPASISEAKNMLINLSYQGGSADYRSSYGSSSLTHISDNRYACQIVLKPITAIIQLADMTAAGNVITGFTLAGIYVDNYYQMQTAEGVVVTDLVFHGQDASVFIPSENGEYPNNLYGVIFDDYTETETGGWISSNNTVAPVDNQVWAYNLFSTFVGDILMPRLVIKLINIKTNDGSVYPDPQFITIRGFSNVETGIAIKKFQSGTVYNIGSGALVFDQTNLSPVPNANLLDVDVSVSLADWQDVDVSPQPLSGF